MKDKPKLDTIPYGKLPPQALDLEKAVLGAVMLEKTALTDVLAIIPTPDVFYTDANQKIYAAIQAIHEKGGMVDLLTVTEQLRATDELSLVGDAFYVMGLTMGVVSSAHTVSHARIVMEKYMLRHMIRVAGQIISSAFDGEDPFELQQRFVIDMNKAFEGLGSTSWEKIADTAREFSQQVQDRKAGKSDGLVLKTTYEAIDRDNEILPGMVVLIAARPSVGKSAFILPMIINEAKKGNAVGVINLEMSNTQTFGRMLSQESRIDHFDLVRGVNVGNDVLSKHTNGLAELPVYFSKSYTMKIEEISASVGWLVDKYDVTMVAIDYLQLINSTKGSNREQEVAKISRGLKTLALGFNIVIVPLSQLNRESDKRQSKKPALSDLRESGSLEQDADVVMLLHRDWMAGITENEQEQSTENEADVIIAKFRNGVIGSVKLNFHGSTMRFTDVPEEPVFSNPRAGITQSYYERKDDNFFKD